MAATGALRRGLRHFPVVALLYRGMRIAFVTLVDASLFFVAAKRCIGGFQSGIDCSVSGLPDGTVAGDGVDNR